MASMTEVITSLSERTAQNRIPWRKGDTSDGYKAVVGDLTFLIVGPREGEDGSIYLSIIDLKGENIGDAIYVPRTPGVNHELRFIFREAREIASDDPRLDAVLDALDTVPPVS